MSTEAQQAEAADLRDLLQHPGWKRLEAFAGEQWGTKAYARMVSAAVRDVGKGPDRAYEIAEVVERVEALNQAVGEVMRWPETRLRQLTAAPDTRPFASFRRTPA